MGVLDGVAAFVTGGGTGIGLACAQTIVDEGGSVTIAGRRTEGLEAAASSLGDRATWVACDVTDNESVVKTVETAVERHGPHPRSTRSPQPSRVIDREGQHAAAK